MRKKTVTDGVWSDMASERAATEGWLLAPVVDEGKPVSSFYFNIFHAPNGKFDSRNKAQAHVIMQAKRGSTFHMDALAVIQMSRTQAAPNRRPR